MIDIYKTYRTRDGRKARVYATYEGSGVASVHGAIETKDGVWHVYSWSEDGYSIFGQETDKDLIEVKRRIKRTVFLHVFEENAVCAPEDAYYKIDNRIANRLACVKVDIDVEEGHGL